MRLAFGGDCSRYDEFCRVVREAIPEGTGVVLRGSAVTGRAVEGRRAVRRRRPGHQRPRPDARRRRGHRAVQASTGFFVPGVHSRPLSEEDPDIAPDLVPLRERLMAMVGRPGQHPGHARLRDVSARRAARPAVPDADRQADDRSDPAAAQLQHPPRRQRARGRARRRHPRVRSPTSSCCRRRPSPASSSGSPTATGMAQWASRRGESLGVHEPRAGRALRVAPAACLAARVPRDRAGRAATCASSACT